MCSKSDNRILILHRKCLDLQLKNMSSDATGEEEVMQQVRPRPHHSLSLVHRTYAQYISPSSSIQCAVAVQSWIISLVIPPQGKYFIQQVHLQAGHW